MAKNITIPVTGAQVARAIDALLDERDRYAKALEMVTRANRLDEAQEIALQAIHQ